MRILIVDSLGAGALIGSQLARAGLDVSFLDPARRVTAQMFKPLEVRSELGHFRQYMRHIEDAEIFSDYDLVILAVQAHQLSGLAHVLPRAVGASTIILPLVHGLEQMSLLEAECQGAIVLDGLHDLVVRIDGAGAAHHQGSTHQILIGARSQAERIHAGRVAALFSATGLDVQIAVDTERRRWEQLVRIVGVAGLAGLMQVTVARIGAIDVNYTHLWALVQECASVAISAGQPIDVAGLAQFMETLPNSVPTPIHAMLDSVANGDLAEVTELVRQMYQAARFASLPTPVLDLTHTALLARAAADGARGSNDGVDLQPSRPSSPPPRRDGWFSRQWGSRTTRSR